MRTIRRGVRFFIRLVFILATIRLTRRPQVIPITELICVRVSFASTLSFVHVLFILNLFGRQLCLRGRANKGNVEIGAFFMPSTDWYCSICLVVYTWLYCVYLAGSMDLLLFWMTLSSGFILSLVEIQMQ